MAIPEWVTSLLSTFENQFLTCFGNKTSFPSETPEANQFVFSRASVEYPHVIWLFRAPTTCSWGWGRVETTQHSFFGSTKFKSAWSKVHPCCLLHWFLHKKQFLTFFGCKTSFPSETPEANQFVFSRAFHRVPTCNLTFTGPHHLFLGVG